jgi:outer membrane receptor protein involved in Fe transport
MLTALGAINGVARGWTQIAAVQANVSQELFKIASERSVGLAAGYEYRAEYGGFVPDPMGAAGLSADYNAQPTQGRFHVNEGYAELSLPLVSKMPGVEELELQAAARAFSYSTFGGGLTYKLAGRYKPIRDVALRGTFSTGFRAPGVSDLYSGTQPSFPSASDPCGTVDPANLALLAQCRAGPGGAVAANNGDDASQIASTVGGNDKLQPEKAKIATVGLVFEPQVVKGLSATVDFWTVSLEQNIGTLTVPVIINGCYPASTASTAAPNQDYCKLITRSPVTGQITDVKDLATNVGSTGARGIDVALRYGIPTDFGRFGLLVDATFLLNIEQTLASGKVIKGTGNYDLGLNPKVKANVGVSYGIQALTALLRARYIGGFEECADADGLNTSTPGCTDGNINPETKALYPVHKVPGQVTLDLSLSYLVKSPIGSTTFSAGMRNLTDAAPPVVYNSFLTYADTLYDFNGRFVYASIRQKF